MSLLLTVQAFNECQGTPEGLTFGMKLLWAGQVQGSQRGVGLIQHNKTILQVTRSSLSL
jgi:hypothetical protein